MSSPRQNTVSSARISSRRPSEIAWRYVISGIGGLPCPARPRRDTVAERLPLVGEDAVCGCARIGHRLRQGPLGLLIDQLLCLRPDRVYVAHTGRAQLLLVALDRVAQRPLLEHFLRHVLVIVVR